jgi:hypothetical protein
MKFEFELREDSWELERLVKAVGHLGYLLQIESIAVAPEKEKGRLSLPEPEKEDTPSFTPIATKEFPEWAPPTDHAPDELARGRVNWMEMEVQTPHLTTPKFAKGPRCADVGAVFRAPHRLFTDQRVFRENRSKRQGSVLVDTSGSMALSSKMIKTIVRAVPAAVIATYGGNVRGNPHLGGLRILAKGGRLVAHNKEYKPVGVANGVDGPALRWLGMQPFPRIWISDGSVTGVGDTCCDKLAKQAAGICERYRIRRVGDLESALRFL